MHSYPNLVYVNWRCLLLKLCFKDMFSAVKRFFFQLDFLFNHSLALTVASFLHVTNR